MRDYKNFTKDNYYHVYNRGHNRQLIFQDEQDYSNFLKRLKILLGLVQNKESYSKRKGNLSLSPVPTGSFDIIAYCLMPNHYHFLIKQNSDLPISIFINKLCTSYVKYFNAKYARLGSIFQDTFKAKLIESDPYLAHLTAYIHNNPGDINSVYSSLREYLSSEPGICNKDLILNMFNRDPEAYREFVINSKPIIDIDT